MSVNTELLSSQGGLKSAQDTKRKSVWRQIFPSGDFMLHFTTFAFLYIREIETEASNGLNDVISVNTCVSETIFAPSLVSVTIS